tara:strand:- start:205 stop:420 length:216 start_codon:yes stop_codon:yes gene_type:complete
MAFKMKSSFKKLTDDLKSVSDTISASSIDQSVAKKKFQNKVGGVIPKDTKLTYNKETGKYTYTYIKPSEEK